MNRTTALSATGAFAFSDIPPADYNLAMKGAKWLRKVVLVTASAGNVSGIAVTLTAGDANNDNKVGLDDLGILSNAFDTKKGDKLFDDRADLNCDGRVDLDDLGLLSLHFDEIGDP